jgi:hypothetical protein
VDALVFKRCIIINKIVYKGIYILCQVAYANPPTSVGKCLTARGDTLLEIDGYPVDSSSASSCVSRSSSIRRVVENRPLLSVLLDDVVGNGPVST